MSMEFGKPKDGAEFKKRVFYKLKDGKQVYRILPPLGNQAATGVWSVYHSVHFGYKNSKDQLRTFLSPLVQDRKTKMTTVPDAALDRLNQLKAAYEQAKIDKDTAKIETLGKLVGNMGRFNLEKQHHMNVIDKNGVPGVLKMGHKAKLVLDLLIKELAAKGIDPRSPDNGRFLEFTRSGTSFDTTVSIAVLRNDNDAQVTHTITENLYNTLVSKNADGTFRHLAAADLNKIYRTVTAEQVARIVKEGAKAVDEIFDSKSEDSAEEPESNESTMAVKPPVAQEQPKVAAKAPEVKAAPQAEIKIATPAPAPVAAAPVKVSMSAEESAAAEADFLSSLGVL